MDTLNDDVTRTIFSFCDSLSSLECVNKRFKELAETTKVYFEGPINSTIFTLKSLEQNGPCYMPFVQNLNLVCKEPLTDYAALNLYSALLALKLESRLQLNLTLILDTSVLELPGVYDYLQRFSYAVLAIHDNVGINSKDYTFQCKQLICESGFYWSHTFIGLESLHIFSSYGHYKIDEFALVKALKDNIIELEVHGPMLSDQLVETFDFVNTKLKILTLSQQSNACTWYNAKTIQKCCPNIEEFTLSSSNLIIHDLLNFDFFLWPLKKLDVSYNYSLRELPKVPNLEHLNITGTSIRPLNITSQVKNLHADISINAEWYDYFLRNTLESATLTIKHFISGPQYESRIDLVSLGLFFSLLDKTSVTVDILETFRKDAVLKKLRPYCKNIKLL
jgi:hypothetical protein